MILDLENGGEKKRERERERAIFVSCLLCMDTRGSVPFPGDGEIRVGKTEEGPFFFSLFFEFERASGSGFVWLSEAFTRSLLLML